jgi:glucosamine kinase
MAIVLGIDAGGTKTDCALADGERVFARVQVGSIKPLRVTFDQAAEHFAEAVSRLEQESGLAIAGLAAVCIGTAGVRLPQTAAWMRDLLVPHTSAPLDLCGDEEIALDAVFTGGPGVLSIGGTGSNVMGRASNGRRLNVGGWGPMLGDEGSGHWISLQALRSALRASDFGIESTVVPQVMQAWAVESVEALVDRAHALPAPDFSQLTPLVAACASDGDAVCIEVLQLGGRLLGEDVVEAARQVREFDHGKLPAFAYIGSAIARIPLLRESMFSTIREAYPEAEIHPDPVDSVLGALWRARRLARVNDN